MAVFRGSNMEKTKQKSQHVILAKARIQFVRSCVASNNDLSDRVTHWVLAFARTTVWLFSPIGSCLT